MNKIEHIGIAVGDLEDGIRRYVHLGTGNYNDATAKLYTDLGLLTCNEEIGEDATVSVIESGNKEFYVFGNNYARGTEILYQAMGLNMPEKVKNSALESGIYTISTELLPEYAGDYVILSKNPDVDNSFLETDLWKNIPAVKNGQVFEINTKASTYSDPITLEHLLDFFESSFLNK